MQPYHHLANKLWLLQYFQRPACFANKHFLLESKSTATICSFSQCATDWWVHGSMAADTPLVKLFVKKQSTIIISTAALVQHWHVLFSFIVFLKRMSLKWLLPSFKKIYTWIKHLSTGGGKNVVAFLLCNLYLKRELKRKPSYLSAGLVVLNSRYQRTVVMSCSNHGKQNFIHSIKGVERKINGYMRTGGKMRDGETKYC